MISPQPSSSDSNLLFAVLALQRGFLDEVKFVDICVVWAAHRDTPIPRLLLERDWLKADNRDNLQSDMERLLKEHHGDVAASIRELARGDEVVRQSLRQILADPGWQVDSADLAESSNENADRRRYVLLDGKPLKGGIGQVWRAKDTQLGRIVALKELRDDVPVSEAVRDRFLAEAQINAQLTHPNIVPTFELVAHDGANRPFYTMQFVKGRTLSDAVRQFHAARKEGKAGDFELRQLLTSFVTVCKAVDYAHDRGVLHRDIKGLNVQLGDHGEVFLLDWGLAKPVGQAVADTDVDPVMLATMHVGSDTRIGSKLGTPGYMAPEQAAGQIDEIDRRTDIYGLGVVLYEILTGRLPFEVTDTPSLFAGLSEGPDRLAELRNRKVDRLTQHIINDPPPPPRSIDARVPIPLEKICLKALAKAKKDRYAGAGELAREVERWLGDEPVSAWPEPWTVKARRWAFKHRPLVTGLATALLVALIGGSGAAWWYSVAKAQQEAELALRREYLNKNVGAQIDAAEKLRSDLYARLAKQEGVNELLSDIDEWQHIVEQIKKGCENARNLVDTSGSEDLLDADLAARLHELGKKLPEVEKDYEFAQACDEARLRAAMVQDGKWNPRAAAKLFPKIFADVGLDVENADLDKLAARIASSPMRLVFLANIDDWARVTGAKENQQLVTRLLELANTIDNNPWRREFRQIETWNNPSKLHDLAQKLDMHYAHSPQILIALATLLPKEEGASVSLLAQAEHPRDFWIHFSSGNLLSDARQREGCYRTALALRPTSPVALINLSEALIRQKRLDEALAAVNKAIRLSPRYAAAYGRRGHVWHEKQEYDKALADFNQAIRLGQLDASTYFNRGNVWREKKEYEKALQEYNEAIRLDPRFGRAYASRGILWERKKEYGKALEDYNEAIRLDPEPAFTYFNRGKFWAGIKEYDKALADYNEAIRLDPQHYRAFNNRGFVWANRKEYEKALADFDEAIRLDPQSSLAYGNRATIWHSMKQYDKALADYNEAIRLDPQGPTAYYNRGRAWYAKKQYDRAVADYQEAVRLNPDYAEANCNLGHCLKWNGDFAGALTAMRRGHELGSKTPGWKYKSADWVKECENLVAMDKRLPLVLADKVPAVTATEFVALGYFSHRYKAHYATAATLFQRAFAADAKLEQDWGGSHRYGAACSAVLVGVGNGKDADKLTEEEKEKMRKLAHGWLSADLQLFGKRLGEADGVVTSQTDLRLLHWHKNANLTGIRDAEGLAKLPAEERKLWRLLWDDAARLLKEVRSRFTETRLSGELTSKEKSRVHEHKFVAGCVYVINLESTQFNTFLKLQDAKGKLLLENDGILDDDRNSRLMVTAPKTEVLRIAATSFQEAGTGPYTLTIREFKSERPENDGPKKP